MAKRKQLLSPEEAIFMGAGGMAVMALMRAQSARRLDGATVPTVVLNLTRRAEPYSPDAMEMVDVQQLGSVLDDSVSTAPSAFAWQKNTPVRFRLMFGDGLRLLSPLKLGLHGEPSKMTSGPIVLSESANGATASVHWKGGARTTGTLSVGWADGWDSIAIAFGA